jgi:hypothetical protein
MFWVMFATSTRRDDYRDVHKLLASPTGSIVRYGYHDRKLSSTAIAESKRRDFARNVLVAYAQGKTFKKGDADPAGSLSLEQGLWVGTRLATLRHLHYSADRYQFYLELLDYPAFDEAAMNVIIGDLTAVGDVPFTKWVAISNLNVEFNSLNSGTAQDNWTSIVNRIGSPPSQFAGDSFWRVARIARGAQKADIQPLMRRHTEVESGKEATTDIQAIFPLLELDKLAIQINSRMPDQGDEPDQSRTVTIATAGDGPLEDLNSRTLVLRRLGSDWIEAEVGATDRIDTQLLDVEFMTGPGTGDYPIGPEFSLRLYLTKHPLRSFFSFASGTVGVSCAAIGVLKDHGAWRLILICGGVLLIQVAQYLWSGHIRLSGARLKQLKAMVRSWIDLVSKGARTIWR